MRSFGGYSGPAASLRVPDGSKAVQPDTPGCWTAGAWDGHELRTARAGRRTVAMFGPCGITGGELARLAAAGVPDDVAWKWEGSYVTVEITDKATRIWTDLGAAWPVCVSEADEGTYWASSPLVLAGLTGAVPDEGQLAARLLAPSVPALAGDSSEFTGIGRVPAGCRAVISQRRAPRWHRVWRPEARPGDPALRLRKELESAVAVRLGSVFRATGDLSGGLDSSSLAVLAQARYPGRLTGVTVHPAGRSRGGDLDYARAVARHAGLSHRFVPLGDEHLPYSRLDAVPPADEPAPSTIAHARFSAQLGWVRDVLRTEYHFTGDGGDTLVLTPPIMLADLAVVRRYRSVWTETARWARLRRLALQPLLGSALRTARSSRPEELASLEAMFRTGQVPRHLDGDIRWFPADPSPTWVTAQARERVASAASRAAERAEPVPAGAFAAAAAAEAIAEVGRTAHADIQLAEAAGVRLCNPFTDSRVIDSYLSVPLARRPGPADYKPVLRDAMGALFPPELAARTTKGDSQADHFQGMRSNLSTLHELADGRLSELGLIDPDAFRAALTMTAAGVPGPFAAVESAVAAEVWLRTIEAARPVAWRPAERHS